MKPSYFEELSKEGKAMDTKDIGGVLYFLAKLIKAETTLEIGMGFGYVSLLLAMASKKHYAIESNSDRCADGKKLFEKYGLNVEIINEVSQKVIWDKKVDLIFQDGSHHQPLVGGDIDKFAPFVKKNGLFCLHDYCWESGTVNEAVDERFKDGWQVITIPFDLGLTICRKL